MPVETSSTGAAEAEASTTQDGLTLLDQIIAEGLIRTDTDVQKTHARDIVGEFVRQIVDKKMKVDADTVASIEAQIAHIDELIAAQLDAILHAKEFQDLEARWRGLHYLVMNTETGTSLKIRVLNVKKSDLRKD